MPQALRVGPQYEASPDFPKDMTEPQGEEQRRAEREQALERLQVFSGFMSKLRDEWIAARRASGWDRRVQEDIDQYHARDPRSGDSAEMMNSVRAGGPVVQHQGGGAGVATRSKVFIGLTRQKSNAAEARLSDILLPTDEKNWGIKPTPVPTLAGMAMDNSPAVDPATGGPLQLSALNPATGQMEPTQVKKSDVALAAEEVARNRAKAMEREIDDQLVECDYNSQVRAALHNAAVMGTGVLRGPLPMTRFRNSWAAVDPAGEVYELQAISEKKPATISVDPRFVWEDPDCGDDIQNGRGVIELEQKTKRQVRELEKQEGYIKEALAQVLEEGPKRSQAMVEAAREGDRKLYQKASYDVWMYVGEIDQADMRTAQILNGEVGDTQEEEIDPFSSVSAIVVVINDTVVKVAPNPAESGELPYDFYPWEKVSDSPRGYGVPYLMRAPQKVINAAWRMMLDNAAICAGPQIIMRKGKLEPEDGSYKLYARKVWLYAGEDDKPVGDAFSQVEFNMHQAELANIIKLGVDLADAETSTPMISQGEQGGAPDTVGGMQLLMNSANVVLRRLVKQFDDLVTRRHIRRYYDYNMAYSDKKDIKGDFSVDARGSSALLVRDIQNQAFTNLLAAGANPVYAKFIDEKKLFEKALAAQHIQPQDIMKTDAQIQQAEQQQQAAPPDPRVQAAEINAKARLKEAEAISASRESEVELRREIAQDSHETTIARMELDRDLKLLEYAKEQKITLDQAKVQLAMAAMNNRQKSEQVRTEAELRRTTGEGI